MIKACIFDLDGVIVDTAKYHFLAWKRIADYLGFEFTEEQNEGLKGISRLDSLRMLAQLGGITLNEKQEAKYCHTKNSYYLEYIESMGTSEILPGVKPFLHSLKSLGIKMAIGSASKNAKAILQKIGLIEFFDVIIDGNAVSRSKPDPEVFVKAATFMGCFPSESIVFEDSQKGIEAAKQGGFFCIGIGSIEHLSEADHVIPGFKGLDVNSLLEILSVKLV